MAPQWIHLHWFWLAHSSPFRHLKQHGILAILSSQHWLLVSALGGVVLAIRKLRQRAQEARAAGWPVADALVLTAQTSPGDGYWVLVEYRYFAREDYHYGKFRRHFRRKAQAEAFSAAVRRLHVPVHYRSDNPDVSVLIERDLQLSGQATGLLEPKKASAG